jgi:mannobiose 2-epimerase
MNRMTQDSEYLTVFKETSDFIEKNMVDWNSGEWHGEITPGGTARGDKANAWKAGYHNGRSMIECLQILKQWKD